MLESGIGRAHNVHLSTLPNFSLPGDVSDSRRYFKDALVEPPMEVASDGTIAVPTGPGIGHRVLEDVIRKRSLHSLVLKPS
jgi:O-succinylbenzoate synthase